MALSRRVLKRAKSKSFVSDLKIALKLYEGEKQDALVTALRHLIPLEQVTTADARTAVGDSGLDVDEVADDVLPCFRSLVSAMATEDIGRAAVMETLREAELDDAQIATTDTILGHLETLVEDVRGAQRRANVGSELLPTFRGISAVCDIRAVSEEPRDLALDDVIPVVVLRFGVETASDDDSPKQILFQTTRKGLSMMLKTMGEADALMERLEAVVRAGLAAEVNSDGATD